MVKDNTNDEGEQAANPIGRPLNFQTVEELDAAIEAYIGDCAPHVIKTKVRTQKVDGSAYWAEDEVISEQKPVTVSGAAYALKTSRRTLLSYKDREEFLPSIERLLSACEAYAEAQLFGPAANGAKFNLINNYRGKHQAWADKQEITGADDAPLMPIGLDAAILARRTGKTDGSATPSTAEDSDQPS